MADAMNVDRRRVLGGAVAAGGLLVSGCHTRPAVPSGAGPAVPWPDGDILGIGLESYPYPYPVQYLDVTHVAQADWIDRQAPDWERRARLAYMDVAPDGAGSKGAVVLAHGKNFFGAYWAGFIETLRQEGFRVIVPDLIGWGKSTKPSTLTVASLVAHLRSLLDQLKVDSVVFIGHSTGGLVGMHMARALPERVRGLVLENPMGLEDYRIGLTQQVRREDWANDERSMTVDQIRQYMAHYFVNKDPRFVSSTKIPGSSSPWSRYAQPSGEGPNSSAGCRAPRRPPTCFSTSLRWTSSLPWRPRRYSSAACPTAPMWARNILRPKIQGPRGISRKWPRVSRPGCPRPVSWVCPIPATSRIWKHRPRSIQLCSNFC
ncbi:MAG: alpha/beta fold hydrolase, partial [Mycobacterium sp.]